MRTCCICGVGHHTTVANETILIYGCPSCGRGDAALNERSLNPVRSKRAGTDHARQIFPYGKPGGA